MHFSSGDRLIVILRQRSPRRSRGLPTKDPCTWQAPPPPPA